MGATMQGRRQRVKPFDLRHLGPATTVFLFVFLPSKAFSFVTAYVSKMSATFGQARNDGFALPLLNLDFG
jgi:hypothetical protein